PPRLTSPYTPPATYVFVRGADGSQSSDADWTVPLDFPLTGGITVSRGPLSAYAIATLNVFAARAFGGGAPGDATARSFQKFVIHDPQGRDQIKVNWSFTAVASASPAVPSEEGANNASYGVAIMPYDSEGVIVLDQSGASDDLVYAIIFPGPDPGT